MNRCLVCGQPLSAQSRADKLTCSHSCRTRRYRLAQGRANPTGSLPWRRQLHLTQPIRFYKRKPNSSLFIVGKEPDPVARPNQVPAPYWDTTLEAMNLLSEADQELEHVLGWPQNKWGANGHPVTGDPIGAETATDISWALRGHLDNLYTILDQLHQLRGRVERWLMPQRAEFGQRLIQLRKEIRTFSQGVEHLYTRYEILYQPGLVETTTQFRERIRTWWFELNDEVD